MYTCAGANSVPVCVSPQDREASKSNAVCWPFIAPCCGFIPSDAPSPLRTPEDSQTYEHISRSILPVSARPVSVCQLPTFSDVNPVQARKGGRQIEKTHNTEGLGSENISMFFSNSIANRKGFLPRPARFRGWTGTGEAGSWQADTGRELTGDQTFTAAAEGWVATGSGAFGASTLDFNTLAITGGTSSQTSAYNFRASRVWGNHSGVEFAPVHIWQPCIVYLGNSA